MKIPKHVDQYNGAALQAYQVDSLVRAALKQLTDESGGSPKSGSEEMFDIETLLEVACQRSKTLAEEMVDFSENAWPDENVTFIKK